MGHVPAGTGSASRFLPGRLKLWGSWGPQGVNRERPRQARNEAASIGTAVNATTTG